MNKHFTLVLLRCCLIIVFLPAISAKTDVLDRLINSKDAGVQRQALFTIAKNKSRYSHELAQRIESCYKRKGPYHELETLLYVAALIKCKEAVPILETIWLDQTSFENDCIYCCPRSLVMTVFGLHGLWRPRNISLEQRQTDSVENTLSDLERLNKNVPAGGSRDESIFEGTAEYTILAKEYLSLKEKRLLEIATNSKATYPQRLMASIELNRRVVDDHLLADYYWWALNACEDASAGCLSCAHESILSAELCNSRHKH